MGRVAKPARIDIASLRREQITEAAVAIISEQGLQNLSLSAIEQKAGMSRGQLTYYFRAKEDILLAVFDRLLVLMYQRMVSASGQGEPSMMTCSGWERVRYLLAKVLVEPPAYPEFGPLQYTFLSQIGHRDDFRQRLANLYEEWRTHMAEDLSETQPSRPAKSRHSPRALASFIQAVLHGLGMQRAADPNAFDREEMLALCLDILETYLQVRPPASKSKGRTAATKTSANGSRPRGRPRRSIEPPKVSHD
jgi:AcrR family transcriptional regulator